MTPEQLRSSIKRNMEKLGHTQASLAKMFGFSPQYLGDVLNGRRDPGDKILNALGYERVVSYRVKDEK